MAGYIMLYHHIGTQILKAQERSGWGAKVIDQLSKDLSSELPEMKGFSMRNLKYMRKFAAEYPDIEFVQEVLAQLPWGHFILANLLLTAGHVIFYLCKSRLIYLNAKEMQLQILKINYLHRNLI